jgi:CHAP domain
MSIEATLQRIATIDQALANPVALVGAGGALTGGTAAPGAGSSTAGEALSTGEALATGEALPSSGTATFAEALQRANADYQPASTPSASAAASSYAPLATSSLAATPVGSLGAPAAPAGLAAPTALTATPAALYPATQSPAPGARIVAAAETQLGQTEQPPGSNESPAIAMYRSATSGAIPGAPWCAYFASWASRQAGEPLGANGEGLGSVAQIWSWAQSTGRAIPNGPGVVPKPGDLIVFGDEHVGIVRGVLPNGNIQTIEGNYENKVALNERPPGEATGYVEMS